MSSIKCRNCGLANFSSETECRRCQNPLGSAQNPKSRSEKTPRRFSIFPLIMLAIAAAFLYYAYNNIQGNVSQINANEANRVATQAKDPAAGLSRTEYDRRRAGQYGNAIKDSPSLAASEKHNEETQKMMQEMSNSQQK